jgi:hypothetical protein
MANNCSAGTTFKGSDWMVNGLFPKISTPHPLLKTYLYKGKTCSQIHLDTYLVNDISNGCVVVEKLIYIKVSISLLRISLSVIIFWLDGPFYVSLIRSNMRYCIPPVERVVCLSVPDSSMERHTHCTKNSIYVYIPRNETARSRIRVRRHPHCTENPIYVFPDVKLRGPGFEF